MAKKYSINNRSLSVSFVGVTAVSFYPGFHFSRLIQVQGGGTRFSYHKNSLDNTGGIFPRHNPHPPAFGGQNLRYLFC